MKRIAMIMPGGVASRDHDVHIPSLYMLVSRLSEFFDITVYSLITFGEEPTTTTCGNATVKFVQAYHEEHWTKKMISLFRAFSLDHRKNHFHLIHGMLGVTTELTTVLASKFYAVPSVVSLLGGETANIKHLKYGTLSSNRLRLLMKYICREVTRLTVLTNFQVDDLKRHKMDRNNIPVIPFGVDTGVFHAHSKRIPEEPYRFLHVANIIPLKDQETLLRAFKLITDHKQASLRIIGPDYSNGKIQTWVRHLGIGDKVELLGYLPHGKLVAHFEWADVLLHTSLHEAQGVVIAEAAATQTLVAGTKVGLIADFSEDKAIGVSPGDYKSLAQNTLEILSSPTTILEMRERALKWAIVNDITRTVAEYRRVYEDTMRM